MSFEEQVSYRVFGTSEAAGIFLSLLFRTYATMDDLREHHRSGIVVIAKGEHNDDYGKTVNCYRVVFSLAPPWKK